MTKLPKELKAKHVKAAKRVKEVLEDELGTYTEGGPAIVIAKPEWDGLTKKVDVATEDEQGAITSVVIHMSPDA
jgi:hypothetical protein